MTAEEYQALKAKYDERNFFQNALAGVMDSVKNETIPAGHSRTTVLATAGVSYLAGDFFGNRAGFAGRPSLVGRALPSMQAA